ncbi:MAG: GNAT family protein [Myxococcota bacterium]
MVSETGWLPPERFDAGAFVLRSFLPGDGVALYEAIAESRAALRPRMAWVDGHTDAEASERIARAQRARWLLHQDFTIGVFAADGATVLGGTGYHLREGPLEGGQAEMGMWIRASRHGQGLGTEVLRALLRWGFSPAWGWLRLAWRCDANNLASRRVAEKAGLHREGVLRHHARATKDGAPQDTWCFAALASEARP